MKKYLSYILLSVIKRVPLWIVTLAYLLIICTFIVIVPLIEQWPNIIMWVSSPGAIQAAVILLLAIFSAVVTIFIFREPVENGTELIIISKGISRKKIVLAKFLALIILLSIFSLIPEILLLLLFAIPQMSNITVLSLLLSLLVGNFVVMIVYGSIAALLSLKLNKVLVMVITGTTALVLNIYALVSSSIGQGPLSVMTNSKQIVTENLTYANKDDQAATASAFIPSTNDFYEIVNTTSLDYIRELWQNAEKQSKQKILNAFDFNTQLNSIYRLGAIWDAWYNYSQTYGMGGSDWLDYSIKNKVNLPSQNYVNPEQSTQHEWKPLLVNDDNPYWTNFNNVDCPSVWLVMSGVNRNTTKDFVDINKNVSRTEFYEDPSILLDPIVDIYSNAVIMVLKINYNMGNSRYFYDVSKTETVDSYIVSTFYEGPFSDGTRISYNYQWFKFSDYEVDLFNWMLYNILFEPEDATSEYKFIGSSVDSPFLDTITNEKWQISLSYQDGDATMPTISKKIYELFFADPKVKAKLNISNLKDYSLEIMKFKYWTYLKLTGQAGLEDYTIKNFNYDNAKTQIVPWDAYFKCVYYPLFNSMNTANINEFNDDGKKIARYGFIPINNYYMPSKGVILLNDLLGTEERIYETSESTPMGFRRLTPTYNGEQYTNTLPGTINNIEYVNADIFKAYDFGAETNWSTWSDYPTINKYGYISRLGLKMSEFLSYYITKGEFPIYYEGQWNTNYINNLFHQDMPYFYFTNLLFNFESTPQAVPGLFIGVYLSLALILIVIGYSRYIKNDVM